MNKTLRMHKKRLNPISALIQVCCLFLLSLTFLIVDPVPAYAYGNCPGEWTQEPGPGPTRCRRPADADTTLYPNTVYMADSEEMDMIWAEEALAELAEEAEGAGATALSVFYYSMGRNSDGSTISGGRDTCLTCDFITYFLIAMAQFSATLFGLWATFFQALGPVLIAAWIAIRVIQLNFNGGQGGSTFFMDLVKKLTIFFFAWMIFTGAIGIMGPVAPGDSDTTYFGGPTWTAAGPGLLEKSFQLNNDVRSQTAAGLMAISTSLPDSSPFECGNLANRVRDMVDDPGIDPAVVEVTQTACVVERMHVLGIATSVALITSAWNQLEFTGGAIFASVMKTVWGFILIAIFGLSMVWLVFVLLDVVVKALIVAAFLPLFGLTFLFKPTRDVSKNAFMQLIGVPVVAFALGLTSLLGFYLITATPTVYNNTYGLMSDVFQRPLLPITASDTVGQFAEFISRIQLNSRHQEAIPAYISSPWLIYIMLVGLGIFSLGKKIISIIEEIMGIQGTTELANNAKKLAMQGAGLAMGGAATVATGGLAAAGAGVVGGAAVGGSAVSAAGAVGGKLTGQGWSNKVSRGGLSAAKWGGGKALGKYTPFGRGGRWGSKE